MANAKISLKGLDKAKVLAVLYNASKPQGMGFARYDAEPMSVEEAEEILKTDNSFDYLMGRVMKVNLSGDELDPWGYDRDNGAGAAERAIASLTSTGKADSELVQKTHEAATKAEAMKVKSQLHEKSRYEEKGLVGIFHLGYSHPERLNKQIDDALKHIGASKEERKK